MSASLRELVLEIFERHRATPGAPFDESHFIDYLLANPHRKRAVHNSFRGLRRYNAFIDELQLRLCICFSVQDFEANYSLSKFIERVTELKTSRRSSLASFRNQRRYGFGWGAVFLVNLLIAFLTAGATRISGAFAIALLISAIVANIGVVVFYLRWKNYRKQLEKLLSTEENNA